MILTMDFGDSIKRDSVDQVWDSSNRRARQINANDSKLWKLITRVAKAGIGMQNEIKESRSGGFAIVTSNDASEFFFGADVAGAICFLRKFQRRKQIGVFCVKMRSRLYLQGVHLYRHTPTPVVSASKTPI